MDKSGTTDCSTVNERSPKTAASSDCHHKSSSSISNNSSSISNNSSSMSHIHTPGAPLNPSPPPDYEIDINAEGGKAMQSTFEQPQIPHVESTPVIPDHEAPDHLLMAILATIVCLPLGIVAILRSKKCRSAKLKGDREHALLHGSQAKRFSMIGFGCAAAIIIIGGAISRFLTSMAKQRLL